MTTTAELREFKSSGTTGLVFVGPAGAATEPRAKVETIDWRAIFGLSDPQSPDEALVGTTLRRAFYVIRNW